MISYNQFPNLLDRAITLVREERHHFDKAYNIVEDYVKKNPTNLLGASNSINKLIPFVETEFDNAEYMYELYSATALKTAYDISNALAKEYDLDTKKIVMMKSVIPYKLYRLYIDARLLVEVYSIGDQYVNRINKDGLNLLGPENILIDIYRTMYSPSEASKWADAIKIESKIFRYFDSENKYDAVFIKQNSKSHLEELKEGGIEDKYMQLAISILDKSIQPNSEIILIGEHAVKYLYKQTDRNLSLGEDYKLPTVITVITSINQNVLFGELTALANKVFGPGKAIEVKRKGVNLVKDFRLKKTIYKYEGKDILYVYNSTDYELVPKIELVLPGTKSITMGNIFVISRFLLIELYIMYNIYYHGKINHLYASHKINLFINICKNIRKFGIGKNGELETIMSINKSTQDAVFSLFPAKSDDYLGTHKKESIAIKELINEVKMKYKLSGQTFRDYFPQLDFAKTGHYRQIREK